MTGNLYGKEVLGPRRPGAVRAPQPFLLCLGPAQLAQLTLCPQPEHKTWVLEGYPHTVTRETAGDSVEAKHFRWS